MTSLHKGLDSFTAEPGKVDSCRCGVCGEECEVQRNVDGPTGYAEAVGGLKHLHDRFTCKHYQELWHRQARALIQEKDGTNSTRLKRILQEEIDEILSTKQTTGDWEPGYLD